MKERLRRSTSVATKIAISFSLLIFFLIVAAGCSHYLTIRQVMELRLREKGEAVSYAVAALAAEQVRNNDTHSFRQLFLGLQENKEISGAALIDSGGRIVAHTDSWQTGKIIPEGLSEEAIFQERSLSGPVVRMPVKTPEGTLVGHMFVRMDPRENDQYLQNLALNLALFLLAAVLAGIMLAHIVSKRLLRRPVGDLIEATRRIATGDFTYQAPVRTRDELGELAQAFNIMAGHLTNLFRIVHASSVEMAKSSRAILSWTESCLSATGGGQEEEAKLTEINQAARRLSRVLERLNGLSLQFKVNL